MIAPDASTVMRQKFRCACIALGIFGPYSYSRLSYIMRHHIHFLSSFILVMAMQPLNLFLLLLLLLSLQLVYFRLEGVHELCSLGLELVLLELHPSEVGNLVGHYGHEEDLEHGSGERLVEAGLEKSSSVWCILKWWTSGVAYHLRWLLAF